MPKKLFCVVSSFGIERVAKMHYLYILRNNISGKYYIGETTNVQNRIQQHKRGRTVFGKRNSNLVLVYKQEFKNRAGAKKIESFLKRQKSHKFIDKFMIGKIHIPR